MDHHKKETRYESVTEVIGSSSIQTAYRLERESNLTISAVEAFPAGIPHQFSFECTFRTRKQPRTSWYLFHVYDASERSQLSIILDPKRKTLEVLLPDVNGDLQRIEFYATRVRDFCFII